MGDSRLRFVVDLVTDAVARKETGYVAEVLGLVGV
jgi:hypothetical protein